MVCRVAFPNWASWGGRCEVGEARELWDVVTTIYRMRERTEIWQVMRHGHVI